MPNEYHVRVNTFSGSATGHVNISVRHNGEVFTFGNNTSTNTNGGIEWGVRNEQSIYGRADMGNGTWIPITQAKYEQMLEYMEQRADDPDDYYGLLFRNCVDFIRDVLQGGNVDRDVSELITDPDLPVTIYARMTDFMENAGFGGLMDGIGYAVGLAGEGLELVLNLANQAWQLTGDIMTAAGNFVSDVGSAIGGFFGSVATAVSNFFQTIFPDDEEDPPGDIQPNSVGWNDDDFVLSEASMAALPEPDGYVVDPIYPDLDPTPDNEGFIVFVNPANDFPQTETMPIAWQDDLLAA
jgi:hypothetical protein